ncbi:MAG: class I SAM-dependent methyltransferase [Myxococcales bacterium]|nr:class I SAM-dependent methyltransferase [Myxococcales bacterium]MCB9750915.1 class I SAM-dependent methyltransferase [Myxococcales bacterium]
MLILFRKLRLMPKVLMYRMRGLSARDYGGLWESYWGSVQGTGSSGEVLWDTEDEQEIRSAYARFAPSMDHTVPILDLGCGNGRISRFLAERFERVVGIDVSPSAIDFARAGAPGNASFRVANAIDPADARALHAEFGDMNIFMRGVLHVVQNADRAPFLRNLRLLLGQRGALYMIETDGRVLDYMLERPDDSPTGLPRPMHKVISHGILPHGFNDRDSARWFPRSEWNVLQSGETEIHTIQLPDGSYGRLPAYFMLARPRPQASC